MISSELQKEVKRGVVYLRQGGVVAFPTDTFYGLGADVFSVDAVMRVFRIKGRRTDIALPVLLADASELCEVAVDLPLCAHELAERFWPGALTLVLKRAPRIPALASGGDTIGVRVPDHPVPRALVHELGAPVTGTSANPTGHSGATSAEQVRCLLGDTVDYVIDGGRCQGGQPSTVLDLTGATPRVVREGRLPLAALQPFFATRLTLADD